jgi:hypothetical protein
LDPSTKGGSTGGFAPGDPVRHLLSHEEGKVIKPLLWTIGYNNGEGLLVEVNGREKFWFMEEVELLNDSAGSV